MPASLLSPGVLTTNLRSPVSCKKTLSAPTPGRLRPSPGSSGKNGTRKSGTLSKKTTAEGESNAERGLVLLVIPATDLATARRGYRIVGKYSSSIFASKGIFLVRYTRAAGPRYNQAGKIGKVIAQRPSGQLMPITVDCAAEILSNGNQRLPQAHST